MGKFLRYWVSDLKNFFCWKNLMVMGVILILSTISVDKGIAEYKASIKNNREFLTLDKMWIQNMNNYVTYSTLGVNVAFTPSASMIFNSNPSIMDDVKGRINSINALEITTTVKGKLFSSQNAPFRFQLPYVLLFFGVLGALIFGFLTTRDKEYLKSIAIHSSPKVAFFSVVAARLTMIIFWLLVIFGSGILLSVASGIPLRSFDFTSISSHFTVALLMLIFFFLLGTFIGRFRSIVSAVSTIFAVWFIFVLIIPIIVNSIVDKKNELIRSAAALDIIKFEIAVNFEKEIVKKYGEPKKLPIELKRKLIEGYFINEFKELERLEEEYKKNIISLVQTHDTLYMLSPTTFYLLTVYEASSRGYRNYLEFYTYLQKLRHDFLRFWLDRVYYNDPKIIKSFVTKDENVFRGHPHVPVNFTSGLLFYFGLCILMLFGSYVSFKRTTFPKPGKNEKLVNLEFEFTKGIINSVFTNSPAIPEQIVNIFTADKPTAHPQWKFFMDGKELDLSIRQKFLYIPKPAAISSQMKVKNLLAQFKNPSPEGQALYKKIVVEAAPLLNKSFVSLEVLQKANILIYLAEMNVFTTDIIIFNDLIGHLPHELQGNIPDRLNFLAARGALIINFESDRNQPWDKYGDFSSFIWTGTEYFVRY